MTMSHSSRKFVRDVGRASRYRLRRVPPPPRVARGARLPPARVGSRRGARDGRRGQDHGRVPRVRFGGAVSHDRLDERAPSRWLADVPASLVVFLVALPLCIGIAVACGVPPERGLITGIVGGIVVGTIAGAPLLVSGPAASLIV